MPSFIHFHYQRLLCILLQKPYEYWTPASRNWAHQIQFNTKIIQNNFSKLFLPLVHKINLHISNIFKYFRERPKVHPCVQSSRTSTTFHEVRIALGMNGIVALKLHIKIGQSAASLIIPVEPERSTKGKTTMNEWRMDDGESVAWVDGLMYVVVVLNLTFKSHPMGCIWIITQAL